MPFIYDLPVNAIRKCRALYPVLFLCVQPTWAKSWRSIEPDISSKTFVTQTFGEPSKVTTEPTGELVVFSQNAAPENTTQVRFHIRAIDQLVDSIDVFPAIRLTKSHIEVAYGPACKPRSKPMATCYIARKTKSEQSVFDYVSLGVVVFFNEKDMVDSIVYKKAKPRE